MTDGGPSRARTASESEPSAGAGKPSRRRISHISKACNGCRRRKMKCDGAQPSCAICKVYKEECVYNPEQDGRRSTPKAYVSALEHKISLLEAALKNNGIDPGSAAAAKGEKGAGGTGEASGSGLSESEGKDNALDLKMDASTGELLTYGPTSVFNPQPIDHPGDASGTGTPVGASDSPGQGLGIAGERHARLVPAPLVVPELGMPELDSLTHEEVLRLFFTYFNPQSFWVDERRFRRDLLGAPTVDGTIICPRRTAYYSPLLHNIILAIGVAFLTIDARTREQLGIAFAKRAKDLLEEEVEAPMLSTVSGVLLMGTYHASVARHNLGYVYAGMAFRLVQALGLGTNCSYWVKNGKITEETKSARYTLFYTSYILDKCWSTYVGRGASLPQSTDIPDPTPDHDEDAMLWQPIMQQVDSSFDPSVPQGALDLSDSIMSSYAEPVKGWRSTTWVYTYKLSIIAERVLGTVYSRGFNTASVNVQHIVSDIDVSLQKFLDTLPDPLRLPTNTRGDARVVPSHILGLHALYYFILILLHRPWFAQIETHPDLPVDVSVSKCEKAATKVVQILALYRRCPGLRYCPITLGQVAFTAGTVHILSATHSPSKHSRKVKTALEGAQACVTALEEMGQSLRCAAVSGRTLKTLLDEFTESMEPKQPPAPAVEEKKPEPEDGTDIAAMLRDPAVAEQLRRLGWAPPGQAESMGGSVRSLSPPQLTPSHSSSHLPGAGTTAESHALHAQVPVYTQADTNVDFAWFMPPMHGTGLHLSPTQSTHHALPHHHTPSHSHSHGHHTGHLHTPMSMGSVPNVDTAVLQRNLDGTTPPLDPGSAGSSNEHVGTQQQQQAAMANLANLSSIYEVLYAGASNPSFPSGNAWAWPFGFDEERR